MLQNYKNYFIFKNINFWEGIVIFFRECSYLRSMKNFVERKEYFNKLLSYRDKDIIKAVTGLRRSGKGEVFCNKFPLIPSIYLQRNFFNNNFNKNNLKMKKVLIVLTILFAVNHAITAQSVESFIADFAKLEGVETQKIDSEMLAQAKENLEDSDDVNAVEKIQSVEVMKADEPSAELIEKCVNFIKNFTEDADYNTLVKVADSDDGSVLILSSKAENDAKKTIIFAIDDDGVAIVKINGEIDLKDINF